jgi:hypothetical protein
MLLPFILMIMTGLVVRVKSNQQENADLIRQLQLCSRGVCRCATEAAFELHS